MGKYYSDELEKGIELLYFQNDTSKYAEGVKLIQQACDNQEPDAYYIMARCYAWGDGNVKGNDNKAISLSQKGIELGSDLCVLGADRFHELEKMKPFMSRTLAESVAAVKEMAENGNAVAQYAIGLFYYWGDAIGIQTWNSREDIAKLEIQNGAESGKWYKMAAEQGHISAFRNLYISTYKGENGVKKDTNLAFIYAETLKDKVQIPHDMCFSIGCDYEDMKNYEKANEWFELGISKGSLSCINALGLAYLYGQGVQENNEKAIDLFTQGYQQHHSYSTYNLARCYHNGWGCTKDQEKAFELFTIAGKQGVTNAQAFLAQYYDEGLGGASVDYIQCRQWAEKAVSNGDTKSKYYIGKCYLYGYGVPVNYALALRNFQECLAKINHANSFRCLAEMYENGWGVPTDYNLAVANYQNAVDKGCMAATEDLVRFKKNIFGKWKRIRSK